jgi:hypothetical protein
MAAFGTIAGRKIVSSYAGPGTADTVYVDERGGRWVTEPYGATYDETNPPMRGTIRWNCLTDIHK